MRTRVAMLINAKGGHINYQSHWKCCFYSTKTKIRFSTNLL